MLPGRAPWPRAARRSTSRQHPARAAAQYQHVRRAGRQAAPAPPAGPAAAPAQTPARPAHRSTRPPGRSPLSGRRWGLKQGLWAAKSGMQNERVQEKKLGWQVTEKQLPMPFEPLPSTKKMALCVARRANRRCIFAASKGRHPSRNERFFSPACACGEIGRRAVFRRQFRKVWEFESPRAHVFKKPAHRAGFFRFRVSGSSCRLFCVISRALSALL